MIDAAIYGRRPELRESNKEHRMYEKISQLLLDKESYIVRQGQTSFYHYFIHLNH